MADSSGNITLFIGGSNNETWVNRIPLYTQGSWGNVVQTSGNPLYTKGMEPLTTSGTLYILGSWGVSLTSGTPLYTDGSWGQPVTTGLPLFVWGCQPIEESGLQLYIGGTWGNVLLNNMPLYSLGGMYPLYNSGTLYIQGPLSINSGINLYTEGHIAIERSGLPLSIAGSWGSVVWNTGTPLFERGCVFRSGHMPLYIDGPDASISGISLYTLGPLPKYGFFNLFLQGDDGKRTNTLPLFVNAPPQGTGTDYWLSLYTYNDGVTDGGIPISKGFTLYIARTFEGIYGTMPLFAKSFDPLTTYTTLFISGVPNAPITQYTTLYLNNNNGSGENYFELYTHGF